MNALVKVLRFIVNFLSFVIILVCGVVGIIGVFSGQLFAGLAMAIGGVLFSAMLFGVLALLFEIHDHLAALREHFEEGGPRQKFNEDDARIEPSLP